MSKKSIYLIIIISSILFFSNIAYGHEPNEIIAKTEFDLQGGEINGISVCRIYETNLGDMIADALVEYCEDLIKGSQYEQVPIVGIQNGGGIRDSIKAGAITRNQINNVLPYKNRICIYTVTPSELYDILENGVSEIRKGIDNNYIGVDGRFPQISGMKMICDYSQNQKTSKRVLSVYIDDLDKTVDRNDEETIIILAFNDYCCNGNDGYEMLSLSNSLFVGDTLEDILTNYIIKHSDNSKNLLDYHFYDNRIIMGESLGQYNDEISIIIDYENVSLDIDPTIRENHLLLPARSFFELLGYNVMWDGTNKSVNISKEHENISFRIEENRVVINNRVIDMFWVPELIEGYTMIPLELIKNSIECQLDWDSATNSLYVYTKK